MESLQRLGWAGMMLLVTVAQLRAVEPDDDRPVVIEIGQTLADAKEMLAQRGIKFGEGGYALHIPDKDAANLYCVLDEERTSAAIFYSRSKQHVTGISLEFSPSNRSGKVVRSWLSAKRIELERDGSYVVHFLPPVKVEERAMPKSVYPSSLPRERR